MRFMLILLLLCIVTPLIGQFRLSEEAEIAVMTMGPYQEEIYSVFGHTAIRIVDPVNDFDMVYNYGVFDFDQENFYWNFARGRLLYSLGVGRYDRFKRYYISENRYIVEQYLNLTREEKQEVFNFLTYNYLPENREYMYNYVYDNCSSKIPEILQRIFPGRITLDYSFVKEGTTIRDLMDQYLHEQPWGDWIIDVGLGMQIDIEAPPETYLFLPEYVMYALDKATFTRDSVQLPLVSETLQVFTPAEQNSTLRVFTPFNTFLLVFFIVGFFTNKEYKTGKRAHWLDLVLFSFITIFGLWLIFLWSATDHLSRNNLNLLWAIPLHLPLLFFARKQSWKRFLATYFQIFGVWYLLMLFLWEAFPQPLHKALIPLIITLVLRCFYISYDLRKGLKKTTT